MQGVTRVLEQTSRVSSPKQIKGQNFIQIYLQTRNFQSAAQHPVHPLIQVENIMSICCEM